MSAEETPVRRTSRARKINSRFDSDDIDESYRKLVGRITGATSVNDVTKESPKQTKTLIDGTKDSAKLTKPLNECTKESPKLTNKSLNSSDADFNKIFRGNQQSNKVLKPKSKKVSKKSLERKKLDEQNEEKNYDHGSKIVRWRSSTESDSDGSEECIRNAEKQNTSNSEKDNLQHSLGDAVKSFSQNVFNTKKCQNKNVLKGSKEKINIKSLVAKGKTTKQSAKVDTTKSFSSDGEDDLPLTQFIKNDSKDDLPLTEFKTDSETSSSKLKKVLKSKSQTSSKKNGSVCLKSDTSIKSKDKFPINTKLKECNVMLEQTETHDLENKGKKTKPFTQEKIKQTPGNLSGKNTKSKLFGVKGKKLSKESNEPKKAATQGEKNKSPVSHLVSLDSLVLEIPLESKNKYAPSGREKNKTKCDKQNLNMNKLKINPVKKSGLTKMKREKNVTNFKRKSDFNTEGKYSKQMKVEGKSIVDTKGKLNDKHCTTTAKTGLYVVESNSVSYVVEAALIKSPKQSNEKLNVKPKFESIPKICSAKYTKMERHDYLKKDYSSRSSDSQNIKQLKKESDTCSKDDNTQVSNFSSNYNKSNCDVPLPSNDKSINLGLKPKISDITDGGTVSSVKKEISQLKFEKMSLPPAIYKESSLSTQKSEDISISSEDSKKDSLSAQDLKNESHSSRDSKNNSQLSGKVLLASQGFEKTAQTSEDISLSVGELLHRTKNKENQLSNDDISTPPKSKDVELFLKDSSLLPQTDIKSSLREISSEAQDTKLISDEIVLPPAASADMKIPSKEIMLPSKSKGCDWSSNEEISNLCLKTKTDASSSKESLNTSKPKAFKHFHKKITFSFKSKGDKSNKKISDSSNKEFSSDSSKSIDDKLLDEKVSLHSSKCKGDESLNKEISLVSAKSKDNQSSNEEISHYSLKSKHDEEILLDSSKLKDDKLSTKESLLDSSKSKESSLNSSNSKERSHDSSKSKERLPDSSKSKESSLDTSKSKQSSLDSSKSKQSSLYSSKPKQSSLDSSKPKQSSLDSSKSKQSSLDSLKSKQSSLDSLKSKQSSLDSSKSKQSLLDSSKSKQSLLDSSKPKQSTLDSSTTKQSSLEMSMPKQSSIDSSKSKEISLDSSKSKESSLDSSKSKESSLDSSKSKESSLDSSKSKESSLDSSKSKESSLDSSKSKESSLKSSKSKESSLDSSKSKESSLDSSKSKDSSLDSSKSKDSSLDSSKSKECSLDSSKSKECSLDSSKSKESLLDSSKSKESLLASSKSKDDKSTNYEISSNSLQLIDDKLVNKLILLDSFDSEDITSSSKDIVLYSTKSTDNKSLSKECILISSKCTEDNSSNNKLSEQCLKSIDDKSLKISQQTLKSNDIKSTLKEVSPLSPKYKDDKTYNKNYLKSKDAKLSNKELSIDSSKYKDSKSSYKESLHYSSKSRDYKHLSKESSTNASKSKYDIYCSKESLHSSSKSKEYKSSSKDVSLDSTKYKDGKLVNKESLHSSKCKSTSRDISDLSKSNDNLLNNKILLQSSNHESIELHKKKSVISSTTNDKSVGKETIFKEHKTKDLTSRLKEESHLSSKCKDINEECLLLPTQSKDIKPSSKEVSLQSPRSVELELCNEEITVPQKSKVRKLSSVDISALSPKSKVMKSSSEEILPQPSIDPTLTSPQILPSISKPKEINLSTEDIPLPPPKSNYSNKFPLQIPKSEDIKFSPEEIPLPPPKSNRNLHLQIKSKELYSEENKKSVTKSENEWEDCIHDNIAMDLDSPTDIYDPKEVFSTTQTPSNPSKKVLDVKDKEIKIDNDAKHISHYNIDEKIHPPKKQIARKEKNDETSSVKLDLSMSKYHMDINKIDANEQDPKNFVASLEEIEQKNKDIVKQRLNSFIHLEENLYLKEKQRNTSKEVRRMVCDCSLSKEEIENGDKGCGDDCLNRLLMIECGSRCPLKDHCMNKRFQKRLYSKVDVFNAEEKGCGVQAMEEISAGSFIMEYIGEVFDSKEFRRRRRAYAKESNSHFYFMALRADSLIDSTKKGNISRFINHSCDPNAQTQKWTVNGELRIGFFSTKDINIGEEINFDYRMERYGREPQKCYCGTALCRGWLGESPEEKTREEREEDKKKELRDEKKRQEKKSLFDNIDIEDDIEKLSLRGLRNRQDTLDLSRLMVRAEDCEARLTLLQLLNDSEKACKRLFLDYHGLKLLWSWMVDLGIISQYFTIKLKVLETLKRLPITNRTQLTDSKVLLIVERWSNQVHSPPDSSSLSPEELQSSDQDGTTTKSSLEGNEKLNTEPGNQSSTPDDSSLDSVASSSKKETKTSGFKFLSNLLKEASKGLKSGEVTTDVNPPSQESSEEKDKDEVADLATKLLNEWSNLSEAFRIPKTERIEIMKEHEREVEKGYREFLDREGDDRSSYYGSRNRRDSEERRRRRRRNSYREREKERNKIEINEDSGLTKEERRERFELQAAKEEEDARHRKSLQESVWNLHMQRCAMLSRDPSYTPIFDSTGQFYWNPLIANWQQFTGQYENLPIPALYGTICGEDQSSPSLFPDSLFIDGISPEYGPNSGNGAQLPGQLIPTSYDMSGPEFDTGTPPLIPPHQLVIAVPQKWKISRTDNGHIYFYHTKTRISQWQVPTENSHTEILQKYSIESDSDFDADSSSSSTSDSENFSSEEEVEVEQEALISVVLSSDGSEEKMIRRHRGKRKRSNKLVQERVISPIIFEDREAARTERRLAKERALEDWRKERYPTYADSWTASKDDEENKDLTSNDYEDDASLLRLAKKHKANESKAQKNKSKARAASALADTSDRARKKKDSFRSRMATFIVSVLNPYRKSDCRQGRIVSTEDFKYLARKLTHFVMVKELKQLAGIDDLSCNESVKHKTTEFVRKYMSKYGSDFKRDPNDTKEY